MSAGELALRFLLGGAIVSLFSAFGEIMKPKTFAGIFGAAPSVGLATLGLAFAHDSASAVAVQARWFVIACAAMLAYCAACVALTRRTRVPVWLAAAASWLAWGGTAAVLYAAL